MSCTRAERQIVLHGAVQRQIEPAADALEHQVVHVHDFGKVRSHGLQALLEPGSAHRAVAGLDGRRFALDVGQDAGDLADVAASSPLPAG